MYYLSNVQFQNEQADELMECLCKTLKKAHQFDVIMAKTKEIRIAKISNDKIICFNTAQRFLKKYRDLINSYSQLTNIEVIDITEAEAQSRDITHWKSVLNLVEMIVFTDCAKEYMGKSLIEDTLESIFDVKKQFQHQKIM